MGRVLMFSLQSLSGLVSQLRQTSQGQCFRSFSSFPQRHSVPVTRQTTTHPFSLLQKRTQSTATATAQAATQAAAPTAVALTPRAQKWIGRWLFGCAGMVVGIVVVGGITRLTESGLSMVRWEPIVGIRPPITEEEWEREFEQYKQYPEYKYTHKGITLEEFKFIFFWEWFHRVLGRVLGVAFAGPALFLMTRPYVPTPLKKRLLGISLLIGFQGGLGWYMVTSGLKEDPDPTGVPRVSQYRLAAHLGTALVIFAFTISSAFSLLVPPAVIADPRALSLRRYTHGTVGLIFFTALSGAFVAGLDAGLVYNSFPKFADRWIPCDLLAFEPKIRNITENPTTVQFNHRILGMTTFGVITGLWAMARPVNLPGRARAAANALMAMACVQVGLGISTLLYFVPVPLAASHQAGSVCLLTIGLWLMHELKGAAAKVGLKPRK
eukprot:comp21503_c0_seq2/m.29826 comp21503_c0_seq2/g.29826  ORF comp21503_c0_seq2/g.29826 comp21503_c0_seq2/m.29826 type:complete len:437 (-) comp21503_c0_seq2:511-1821(-)